MYNMEYAITLSPMKKYMRLSNMQFGFVKGKSTVDFIRAIANTAKGELWNI